MGYNRKKILEYLEILLLSPPEKKKKKKKKKGKKIKLRMFGEYAKSL